MSVNQKEFVEELKIEWKKLWQERFDDGIRAESVAVKGYDQLFVDKGTIINATRDFKALNFKEIFEEHQVKNAERYFPPNPRVSGWMKFAKTKITDQKKQRKRDAHFCARENKENKQLKQSGRGWLHV
ncbi:MAG: hypothetical protein ACLQO7_04210 [Candidatus Bathyarchaeia archaeon]